MESAAKTHRRWCCDLEIHLKLASVTFDWIIDKQEASSNLLDVEEGADLDPA